MFHEGAHSLANPRENTFLRRKYKEAGFGWREGEAAGEAIGILITRSTKTASRKLERVITAGDGALLRYLIFFAREGGGGGGEGARKRSRPTGRSRLPRTSSSSFIR